MTENQIVDEFLLSLEDMPKKYKEKSIKAFEKIVRKYDFSVKVTALSTVVSPESMILVQVYAKVQQTRGKSERGISDSVITLNKLFSSINKPIKEITPIDIILYLSDYKESRNVSQSTLNGMRSRIGCFYAWAVKGGYVERNPMDLVDKFEQPKKQRDFLTDEELEELRFQASDAREKALIEFMASTACRIAELCSVKLCDVNWSANTVKIVGKGNKERSVAINPKARIAINEYLAQRGYGQCENWELLSNKQIAIQKRIRRKKQKPFDKRTSKEFLFEAKHTKAHPDGQPSEHSIRDAFEGIVARTSFANSKWVTPHTMRHTWATLARKRGMSIEDISAYLGHENIATTMIYVSIDKERLIQDVKRMAI